MPPASRPLPASEPTSICARLPWISEPSTAYRTKTGCASPSWTRGLTGAFCGPHRPITDFWRVGEGYAKKLAEHGLFTMGDVARCSYYNEDLLYRLFGTNAQLLIDHAWGWEPCTMADIKAYQPHTRSLSSGQVLQRPYSFEQAKLVVGEMADLLALELVDKGLVTNQIVLTLGYDADQFKDPYFQEQFSGPLETDCYGRKIPKTRRATVNLTAYTSSSRQMMHSVTKLYEQIADKTASHTPDPSVCKSCSFGRRPQGKSRAMSSLIFLRITLRLSCSRKKKDGNWRRKKRCSKQCWK